MKKTLLIILLGSMSFLTSIGQTTVTFTIDANGQDCAIDDYVPGRANPNEIEYNTCAWTISGSPVIWRDVFRFDMNCIPPNATIVSANLNLYYATTNTYGNAPHESLSNSNESVLQRATSYWVEDSVNWNNQPSVTNVDEVVLAQSTSANQDYQNIDVKNMVQAMVTTPSQNFGFLLKLTNETHYARLIFASGDHPDQTKHPKLIVSYTIPESDCFTLRIDKIGEDAAIDDYVPGRANPNEIEYNTCAWTIAGTRVIWRDCFKFDLPCDLANATIQSAHLSLYHAAQNNYGNAPHESLTSSNESVLQRITSPWTESGVNWNNQPSTTTTDEVILPQSISATQDYTNVDVTLMVRAMFAGQNNGFMLKLTNESHYARMIFASGDNPDQTRHPSLDVCYYIPVGVNELPNTVGLNLYPNPFTNLLHLSTLKNLSDGDFIVYDALGKMIYRNEALIGNAFVIQLPDFASGMYYYELRDKDEMVARGKLEKM